MPLFVADLDLRQSREASAYGATMADAVKLIRKENPGWSIEYVTPVLGEGKYGEPLLSMGPCESCEAELFQDDTGPLGYRVDEDGNRFCLSCCDEAEAAEANRPNHEQE